MKHRKLRIVWSAVWGIAAVLLIALWLRSYWWVEPIRLSYPNGPSVQITSWDGHISVRPAFRTKRLEFERYQPSYLLNPLIVKDESGRVADAKWIYVLKYPKDGFTEIYVPHWMLAMFALLLASASWLTKLHRFTLRTLLIATTLVAVGVGLIVWAAK